jgi:RNA methyltransferase, TrmH family
VTLSQGRRKLLARLRTRKSREREALFLVEGIRSAGEAMDAGAEVAFAVVSPRLRTLGGGEALERRLEGSVAELHAVDDAEIETLSDTETPQGVILVCREPAPRLDDLSAAGAPGALRLLVLDGVQDPGNVGTLVRAAAAFGLDGVVSLEGTADLYGAKVVRASAGGVFRVPLARARWDAVAPWLRREAVELVLADATGEDVASTSVDAPWALVIGSEGAGVRAEVAAAAGSSVRVPMPGGGESLNAAVAGSILLYVLTRERNVG